MSAVAYSHKAYAKRFAASLIILGGAFCFAGFGVAALRWQDETIRVDSNLVVLNLTATAGNGEYVHNLRAADFKVLEDGREQKITTFSAAETPFAAVLLLDASGSMQGRVSLARSAAIRFLEGLRPDDVAAVYSFSSEIEKIQDFSPSRDLEPIAYDLQAEGFTVLHDAIVQAARDLSQRPERRRAIIVLSDGADTRSKASHDQALNSALMAEATIYAVDMSTPSSGFAEQQRTAAVLKSFTDKSGGRYVSSPGGKALRDAFAGIVGELSNQYTIGYQPLNRVRDGAWRNVEVKLARPNVSVRTRRGYRAGKR